MNIHAIQTGTVALTTSWRDGTGGGRRRRLNTLVDREWTESLPIYALRPVRRANYFAAWEQIEAHLAAHYTPVTTVGDVIIYRRN